MTKNVLFLVAGMTPQIITKTLWALACDPENAEQWIPSEIHVMSTGDGLKKIREHLFDKGNFSNPDLCDAVPDGVDLHRERAW